MSQHTVESLIAFERRVADAFAAKQIRAPIHLCSDTQAAPMLEAFKDWKPGDWAFGTWRSHFMCLLAGVPEDEVFDAIVEGRSMFLQFAKYNVFCSAIVGGILPIALGVAAGIKMQKHWEWGSNCEMVRLRVPTVHVFVGDMAYRTGLFHEFRQYATGHELPIRTVVEINGYSTNAKVQETWGLSQKPLPEFHYEYSRTWPHTGLNQRVSF